MKAAARAVWSSDSLDGRVVAMQGFCNVGADTTMHLLVEGAELVVTDTYEVALKRAIPERRDAAPQPGGLRLLGR